MPVRISHLYPIGYLWRFIANGKATAVVYMGARVAGALVQSLTAAGLTPSTGAAALAPISTPREQRWIGRLADLESGVATLPADEPILIGIGDVFGEAQPAATTLTPGVSRADQLMCATG